MNDYYCVNPQLVMGGAPMGAYPMQASPSVYSTGSSSATTSGNNPFGSTGTVKCETCRSRRKKVLRLQWRKLTLVRIHLPRPTLLILRFTRSISHLHKSPQSNSNQRRFCGDHGFLLESLTDGAHARKPISQRFPCRNRRVPQSMGISKSNCLFRCIVLKRFLSILLNDSVEEQHLIDLIRNPQKGIFLVLLDLILFIASQLNAGNCFVFFGICVAWIV